MESKQLIRLGAVKTVTSPGDRWDLVIDQSVDLSSAVTGHCGGDDCDAVVSISPGVEGTVWFITQRSVVGIYDPGAATGGDSISWLKLGEDERIDNSFPTTSDGQGRHRDQQGLLPVDPDGREPAPNCLASMNTITDRLASRGS